MFDILKYFIPQASPINYKDLLKQGALIVDVRTHEEYKSGHIENSVNIPSSDLKKHVSSLKKKGKPIIVCCASGMRSAAAKELLKSQGIDEVYDGRGWRALKGKIQ